MKLRLLPVTIAAAGLALLSFFQFPGHTYLQSDTQIYLPILERLRDPALFRNDLLAQNPHVSFTIYDEMALLLRRLTGMDFRAVLLLQQLLFRALGILGVYLLAASLKLSRGMSLLVAAAFALGATIVGPTVLSLEYEPVPRGFAVPLLLFGLGLAAHGRDLAAGTAVALAFLYHPPTVLPFWAVYFCLTLWPSRPEVMRRRIVGLAPILAGVVALLALSRAQAGISEPQVFFSSLDPALESLQRLRASYIWISTWPAAWIVNYVLLWAASLAAFWRVRQDTSQDVRFFVTGLPLLGLLSMPVSFLLLERWKWALAPQLQPARALVFIPVLAVILAAAAAVKAGGKGRYWESALWFAVVYSVPMNLRLAETCFLDLASPFAARRAALVWLLAGVAALAAWGENRKRLWLRFAWPVAALLPFLVIPVQGRVVNYTELRTPELDALSRWARASTPQDAVYLFPDAGRQLEPGVFRADALRAVYVDWKAGGQVNFLPGFARQWWVRWQQTMAGKFQPADCARFKALGVDYVVVKPRNRIAARVPVYENSRFLVYGIR